MIMFDIIDDDTGFTLSGEVIDNGKRNYTYVFDYIEGSYTETISGESFFSTNIPMTPLEIVSFVTKSIKESISKEN